MNYYYELTIIIGISLELLRPRSYSVKTTYFKDCWNILVSGRYIEEFWAANTNIKYIGSMVKQGS